MSEKLQEMTRRREYSHKRLVALKSKTYAAFLEMEKAAYAEGVLSNRHKELIAVGISVVIDCESCMQWHIEQAARAGASQDEILEAVEVGIEMGGGPATVSARFALEVMDATFSSGSEVRLFGRRPRHRDLSWRTRAGAGALERRRGALYDLLAAARGRAGQNGRGGAATPWTRSPGSSPTLRPGRRLRP
jgi:AhpD family alkylhydroperoxidase